MEERGRGGGDKQEEGEREDEGRRRESGCQVLIRVAASLTEM